jgi:hypothetical protein
MSGLCGRLKCCLRYEFDLYKEYGRGLPRTGARVRCPDGQGVVLNSKTLAQRVKVQLDDERIIEYSASDVRECWTKRGKGRKPHNEDNGTERSEPGAARKARA